MDTKVLKNGHRNFPIVWNGTKWNFKNKSDPQAKNFTISNANKKNGPHRLRVTPQRAFENYTRSWYLNMRNPVNERVKNRMNSLKNYMNKHPLNVNSEIYRGIPRMYNYNNINNNTNYVQKLKNHGFLNSNSFISFSKNRKIANSYARGNGIVIVLGPGRYPAVQNGKNGFISEHKGEYEVLLAPGRITLGNKRPNGSYKVKYTRKQNVK